MCILLIDRFRISITIDRVLSVCVCVCVFLPERVGFLCRKQNKQTFNSPSQHPNRQWKFILTHAADNNSFVVWQLPVDRPFWPATQICMLLVLCAQHYGLCVARCTTRNSISDSLSACGNNIWKFYVNRITHPTSTLKIHKYFSVVSWEPSPTTRTQWVEKSENKLISMTMHILRIDAAAAATPPKGCKSLNFVSLEWKFFFRIETNQMMKKKT